jgi:hypothetical protein
MTKIAIITFIIILAIAASCGVGHLANSIISKYAVGWTLVGVLVINLIAINLILILLKNEHN